ncbi:MAG: signal peptidase I [Eubacterium sp.]|nr:signal peptidase I [Eubacterium sp.]
MRTKTLPPEQRSGRKGGGFVPALFHVLGIVLIVAVIAACIPLTVPKFFGYEIYSIVSGSMRPEYPVGTVVYVKDMEPAKVEEGDVIAFVRENSIVVHRVVQNRTVEARFITKGDANEINDIDPVPYDNMVGRVEKKFPVAGHFLSIFNTFVGKIYFLGVALIGVLFCALSSLLKDKRGKDLQEKELLEELQREIDRQKEKKTG